VGVEVAPRGQDGAQCIQLELPQAVRARGEEAVPPQIAGGLGRGGMLSRKFRSVLSKRILEVIQCILLVICSVIL
jgi:hypothetical protein